jgi:hypothetical protein
MTPTGQDWRSKWLIPIAGIVVIGNHGVQLFKIAVATFAVKLRSIDVSNIPIDETRQWTFYYGPISGLVEAVALISLGVALIRRNVIACHILVWLLPLILVHDLIYAKLIGARLEDMAMFSVLDVVAWIALLFVEFDRRRSRSNS